MIEMDSEKIERAARVSVGERGEDFRAAVQEGMGIRVRG